MDANRFDRLARSLSIPGTRRRLVRVLAALPLGVTLTTLLGDGAEAAKQKRQQHDDDHGSSHRHHRRKARHGHRPGQHKDNPTHKRKRKPSPPDPSCQPESPSQTCAGKCATVQNTCGTPVDCGPCTCATGCPPCQTCNPATGLCNLAANGTGCDDGDACTQTDTCQNGVCVGSTPVVCDPPNACQTGAGTCDPATGDCSYPNAPNRTVCGGGGSTTSICCNGECWDGCCDGDGEPGSCRVFITGTRQDGDLGGLSGADDTCRTRAIAGGLPGADIVGNYKAWLSDSTGSPSSRFRRSGKPYVLPVESSSGQAHQVADDWTDLTTCDGSGCLDHAITVTESGATVGFEWAWTHTLTDGTAEASGFHCGNWQSNEGDFFKPDAVGDFGETNNSGTSWTNNNATACDALIFLYCFQQT